MKKLFLLVTSLCFFLSYPLFSQTASPASKNHTKKDSNLSPSKKSAPHKKTHRRKPISQKKPRRTSPPKALNHETKPPSKKAYVLKRKNLPTNSPADEPSNKPSMTSSKDTEKEKIVEKKTKDFTKQIPLNEKLKYAYTQEEIDLRRSVVLKARAFLNTQNINTHNKNFRRDCSGFIEAVMFGVKKPLKSFMSGNFNGVAGNIFLNSKQFFFDKNSKRLPVPGDFVYFDNTYDRNRNHKLDDVITHIGIVEKVDDDETITMIHLLHGKILRANINLHYPHQHFVAGKMVNSYIRREKTKDLKGTPHLTAEAYHGFTKSLPLIMDKSKPLELNAVADEPPRMSKEVSTS